MPPSRETVGWSWRGRPSSTFDGVAARGSGAGWDTATKSPSVTVAVGRFLLAGAVVVGLLAVATGLASRRAANEEAIDRSKNVTWVVAHGIVEPVLQDSVASSDPAAVDSLDRVVHAHVLAGDLVRLKVWGPDGTIVYSDEHRLIGSRYGLGSEELEALRGGGPAADVSDLSEPENRFERASGKLLEVYTRVQTPSGQPLLMEAYYRYSSVRAESTRIWRSMVPIGLASLIILELVQVPLAWSMARRLQQRERERMGLLRHAADASDAERRRIAGDLHDGVVQDLAAVSFALAAAEDDLRTGEADADDLTSTVSEAAAGTRRSIRGLRTLLVDIYPPSLHESGLSAALPDLVSGLVSRGIEVDLDVADTPGLDADGEALVYRAAQEAVRNVAEHSGASHVHVGLSSADGAVVLEVVDDGRGFTPEQRAARAADGHIGIDLLAALAASSGSRLDVSSTPGSGTRVRLEVPLS
jgi:two-component system NarL family sensor kinase